MRGLIGAVVLLAGLAFATGASYAHELGHTTENHTIQAGEPLFPGSTFETLVEGPGAARVVRGLATATPHAGRAGRRRSLSYFAQLTDFQLADEESPARVEFVDRGPNSAHRPHEAFHPWGDRLQLPPDERVHARPALTGRRPGGAPRWTSRS